MSFLRLSAALICWLVWGGTDLQGWEKDQPNYASDWSRLLHVIVFAERSSLGGDDVTLDVFERDSAQFPIEFSQLLHRGLNRSSDGLSELGLPAQIVLDDVYTFELSDEFLSSGQPTRRWNRFSEMEYFLQISNWTDDSYEISLRGRVRRNGFKGVTAHVSRDKTTILRISDDDCLYFAFTVLEAVGFGDGIARFGDESLKQPVLIRQTIPPVPSELVDRKVTGRGATTVVFIGIIEESGVFNSEEYLMAECPHASFAGEPLSKIFEEWSFQPAERAGQRVRSVVPVELHFTVQ